MGYPHELMTTVGFELGTLSIEFYVGWVWWDTGVFLSYDHYSQSKEGLFDSINLIAAKILQQ